VGENRPARAHVRIARTDSQEALMTDPVQPTFDTPPAATPDKGGMAMRLLHLILVGILIGAATAVLHVMTVVQFVVMLADNGKSNTQIAAFGKSLGAWIAKAARFQTAESDQKPWPWSPLD
jgi:hypothetical protein